MVKPMPNPNDSERSGPTSDDSGDLTALVRDQLRRAYRILLTCQPGDDRLPVVWATGVMEAQNADNLSRFWHTEHHSALHGPWGLHNLGDGRLFEYDQQRAMVTDRCETVVATVPWGEVGALLDQVDSDLRFACDEALVRYDLIVRGRARSVLCQAAELASRWHCFHVAAVIWETVYLQSVGMSPEAV